MDFRKSFSKPFKKLKDKLPGVSRKRDGRSESELDRGKGKEADVEGSEASQTNSYLHLEGSVEGAVESGPHPEERNVDWKGVTLVDVNPPTSAPSISAIGEPGSRRNTSFSVLPLIYHTDNAGSPTIPDKVQDALGSGQGEPIATNESRFELWKSTTSATAKLLLHAVKESADAFPPLKSAVGGLCFILDNYEV